MRRDSTLFQPAAGCLAHLGTWFSLAAAITFATAHQDGPESYQANLMAVVILLSLWLLPLGGWAWGLALSWRRHAGKTTLAQRLLFEVLPGLLFFAVLIGVSLWFLLLPRLAASDRP
jgi:hypothetical protein